MADNVKNGKTPNKAPNAAIAELRKLITDSLNTNAELAKKGDRAAMKKVGPLESDLDCVDRLAKREDSGYYNV